MTIWILALVLLAAGAGLGLRQGAIRAAISLIGIVTAALCAGILGKLLKPLFVRAGIQNPALLWLLAPLVAFILILIVFKVIGFFVHRKAYLFYKYQAGDLRLALWRRITSRLGLCIGLLNGVTYLLLVSFVIFNLSYWTVQIAPGNKESFVIRAINQMGRDLQATGLAGAARSIGSFPNRYYQLADLCGWLRQNPQLKKRFEDYPAFLSLAERPDLKQLGQNIAFQDAWQKREPLFQLLNNPQVKMILKNTTLTSAILSAIETNWNDLNSYLQTGKSPKYDSEKILGRWDFDVNASIGALLIAHPKITPAQLGGVRTLWSRAYADTVFTAAPDHQAYLENLPHFSVGRGGAAIATKVTFQGNWSNAGTNYELSLSGSGGQKSMTAHTDGLRLTIQSDHDNWVFGRE